MYNIFRCRIKFHYVSSRDVLRHALKKIIDYAKIVIGAWNWKVCIFKDAVIRSHCKTCRLFL